LSATVADKDVLRVGDLVLNLNSGEVHAGTRTAQLTPTETDMLRFLMVQSPRVSSAYQLWDELWSSMGSGLSLVRRYIKSVRGKIEDDPAHPSRLVNMRGFGYRIVAVEEGQKEAT